MKRRKRNPLGRDLPLNEDLPNLTLIFDDREDIPYVIYINDYDEDSDNFNEYRFEKIVGVGPHFSEGEIVSKFYYVAGYKHVKYHKRTKIKGK